MTPKRAVQHEKPTNTPGVVVPLGFSGDDRALVEALRENHPGAKAALFERYAPVVERIITHVIGFDRELADIVQEVFLLALGSIHGLKRPDALSSWLTRIATTTARKVLRSRSRRAWVRLFRDAEEENRWEPPAAALDAHTVRALRGVFQVLEKLPADDRIAFSLRFVEGMELHEVAQACDVSLSTIKRRLARAERRFSTAAKRVPELADWLKEQ